MPGLPAIGAAAAIGLGVILAFAVDRQSDGADRSLVGLIMMAAGTLALLPPPTCPPRLPYGEEAVRRDAPGRGR